MKRLVIFIKKLINTIRYPNCKRCEKCGIPMNAGRPYTYEFNNKTKVVEITPSYFYQCDCFESEFD